jgi:hypothetical protein
MMTCRTLSAPRDRGRARGGRGSVRGSYEGTNLNEEDINTAMDTADFVNNIIFGQPTSADQGSSADTPIAPLAEGLEPRGVQIDPRAGSREAP